MSAELRHLRYFVAVAEHLSVSRAAQHLHLAQQSLSQQITALERTLGVRLFDRDTRGTRLTAAGAAFLPEARAVLDRFDAAIATVRPRADRLTVAFLTSTANYMLPPVVQAMRERHPGIDLVTHSVPIAELVAGLRAGRFDAAFTRPPLVPDLATVALVSEPVCAVLPVGHRLAGRSQLQLAELAGEQWVLTPRHSWPPWHDKYDRDFAAAGFRPAVVQRSPDVAALLGLVAAGSGVTRLARSASSIRRSGVEFVPLADDRAETVLAWLPGREGPLLHELREVVTGLAATTDLTRLG
ncbi:LysR family transcriptional regulator [Actinoplanes sp. N902-109]|uniref:LysR family transcriptional regulator n=1 Tax=Actinoplanes sp. (strain N902-109) TaxID=649831 RepID=UPI0003295AE8|nr:LysR family transcriptional regulator [Actinoplanes sp. N902-109]AGL19299.1 LysR family transcriptional regulator [Actinoplanes sp. N902-109]